MKKKDKEMAGEKGEEILAEKGQEISAEKVEGVSAEKGEEVSAEKAEEMSVEKVDGISAGKGEEISANKVDGTPAEKEVEVLADKAERISAEKSEEFSGETVDGISSEKGKEISAEKMEGIHSERKEEISVEKAEENSAEEAEEYLAEKAKEISTEKAGKILAENAEEIVVENAEKILAENAEEILAENAEEISTEKVKGIPAETGKEISASISEKSKGISAVKEEDISVVDGVSMDIPAALEVQVEKEEIILAGNDKDPSEKDEISAVDVAVTKNVEATAKIIEKTTEKISAVKVDDIPVESIVEMPVQQSEEKPRTEDKKMETENAAEMSVEQSDKMIEDKEGMPTEQCEEMPAEESEELPREKDVVMPSESSVEITAEKHKEVSMEATADNASPQEAKPESKENLPPTATSNNDEFSKASIMLCEGKRDFLIKNIPKALVSLEESCRMFSELLGPFAAESGDSHFYYGKALLESARSELAVLPQEGVADDTAEDDDEDEDDEEEKDGDDEDEDNVKEVENKMEIDDETAADVEKEEDLNAPSPTVDKEELAEAGKPMDDDKTNGTAITATAGVISVNGDIVVNDGKSSSALNESTVTDIGEDEPTSLELAWEVLEIAKLSFRKQVDEVQSKLKPLLDGENEEKSEDFKFREKLTVLKRRLVDTHKLLGDVATESEHYTQAEEEYLTALKILGETERDDSREVAQCYFQLGLAYSFDKKYSEAIESFKKSVSLIKSRTENLKVMIETNQTAKDKGTGVEDKNYSEAKEIIELKELLPELEEKVTDTIDLQQESLKIRREEEIEDQILLRNSPVKNPNPPAANDISHLVKKKKKLDVGDDIHKLEPPAKKQCAENGVALPATPAVDTTVTPTNGHGDNDQNKS